MRLIIGCPVVNRGWILPQWFEAIESQGVEHEVLVILSPSNDNTADVLGEHGARVLEHKVPTPRSSTEIDHHLWGDIGKYAYMAELRNTLMWAAHAMGADYFFSLDSDIILPPDGLKQLLDHAIRHPGVIAPAVNMTYGNTTWNVMDWVDPNNPNMAERKKRKIEPRQRDVVMAAMLLDRTAMEVCDWDAHPQGEDVGFSANAWRVRMPLWWQPAVYCSHAMRRY